MRSDRESINIKEFKRSGEIGSVSRKVRRGGPAGCWMTSRDGKIGSPLYSEK
jgi:hypothetical protein